MIAFLSARGADCATCACDNANDAPPSPDFAPINGNDLASLSRDDDGGFFRQKARDYATAGPLKLSGQVLPTRTPAATSTATPTPTSAFSTTARAQPSTVASGQSATLTVSVTSASDRTALIDIEIYSPTGSRVFRHWYDNQAFTAGQTCTYTTTWAVPASTAAGVYAIKVSIFATGWAAQYDWNDSAASITVGSASPTVTPTPTPGSTNPSPTPTAVATPSPTPVPSGTGSISLSSSGYADINPTHSTLNVTADWTREAWFRDDNAAGFNHAPAYLISKGDPTTDSEVPYFVAIDSGQIVAAERSSKRNRVFRYNLVARGVSAIAWHHLAVGMKASSRQFKIYLDGAPVLQGYPSSQSSKVDGRPLNIGRAGASGGHWRGLLDDLRIWSVVRGSTEITAAYQCQLTILPSGLVANWKLDDGSGIADSHSTSPAERAALHGDATWSRLVIPDAAPNHDPDERPQGPLAAACAAGPRAAQRAFSRLRSSTTPPAASMWMCGSIGL